GHPQNEDQGYVDSGCSRHMTWNMSYVIFGDVLCSRHMIKAMLTMDAQTSRNLIEDMLPLGEEPNEGKLLVKELLKLVSLILGCVLCQGFTVFFLLTLDVLFCLLTLS
ncbi:hypothetical protein Tco_1513905, partial [Tanacetum coccineum]